MEYVLTLMLNVACLVSQYVRKSGLENARHVWKIEFKPYSTNCKPLFAWVAYSLYVTAFMLLVELHEKACIPIVVRSVLSDLHWMSHSASRHVFEKRHCIQCV
jgi:hypothetical protein